MTPYEAMWIVAYRLLHTDLDTDRLSERWEDFPDVGEYDWRKITAYATHFIQEQDPAEIDFKEAIQVLAARTEKTA